MAQNQRYDAYQSHRNVTISRNLSSLIMGMMTLAIKYWQAALRERWSSHSAHFLGFEKLRTKMFGIESWPLLSRILPYRSKALDCNHTEANSKTTRTQGRAAFGDACLSLFGWKKHVITNLVVAKKEVNLAIASINSWFRCMHMPILWYVFDCYYLWVNVAAKLESLDLECTAAPFIVRCVTLSYGKGLRLDSWKNPIFWLRRSKIV